MARGYVERRTVYLGSNSTGAGMGSGWGFGSQGGPLVVSPPNVAYLAQALGLQAPTDPPPFSLVGSGWAKLDLARNQLGSIQAISIAPDSMIQSCDLFLGGREGDRHRISPGCPYWGSIDQDQFGIVTPIGPIIGFTDTGPSGYRTSHVWDSGETGNPVNGFRTLGSPLRLNIYRGDSRPVEHLQRAPMSANFAFDCLASNGVSQAGDNPQLAVCVDGRQRIDISVQVAGIFSGIPVVTVIGYDPILASAAGGGPVQLGVAQTVLASAQPFVSGQYIKSYQGNPFQYLSVQVGGGTYVGGMRINAWDV
jgi:hypothetical protein